MRPIRPTAAGLLATLKQLESKAGGDPETDLTAPLRSWDKFMASTIARTPVRRWGTPDDMGAAAVFLADPTLTFHTGDCIVVDGGYTIF